MPEEVQNQKWHIFYKKQMEVSLAPFDICEFASELPWQFSWKINFTDTPFERI